MVFKDKTEFSGDMRQIKISQRLYVEIISVDS